MLPNPMPKPGLPRDARDVLAFLQEYTDSAFPGARVDLSIFRASGGVIDGFALHHDGGLSLIYVDATETGSGGQWVLQMSTVLAVDVCDVIGALLWTNDRNRRSTVDRYYCVVNREASMCAVAADTSVASLLLSDFAEPPNVPIVRLLTSLARNTVYTAAVEPLDLLKRCPGRRLTISEQDLMTLFVVAGA